MNADVLTCERCRMAPCACKSPSWIPPSDMDSDMLDRRVATVVAHTEALAAEALRVRDQHAFQVDAMATKMAGTMEIIGGLNRKLEASKDIIAGLLEVCAPLTAWFLDYERQRLKNETPFEPGAAVLRTAAGVEVTGAQLHLLVDAVRRVKAASERANGSTGSDGLVDR